MEACATSHYWGREIQALGHQVKMIPPQHVKAYLRGNKNDYNDAQAIAEATSRPTMRCVAIKTTEQQDIQALHRLRDLAVKQRTALGNQIRGLLAEYGVVIARGHGRLRAALPDLLSESSEAISSMLQALLVEAYDGFRELDQRIARYDAQIKRISAKQPICKLLQSIPGFGPVVASVFYSAVGDGTNYRRGRDVSASLGLVPKQHSSGGKDNLLGISKRGDKHLRYLLVHGARSVVKHAADKDDVLSRWINHLHQTRGYNKAAVALANKLARIGWAVITSGEAYRPAEMAS